MMDWSSLILPGLAGGASTLFFVWLINRPDRTGTKRTCLETSKGVFWFLVLFSPVILLLALAGGYSLSVGVDSDVPNPFLGVGLGSLLVFVGISGLWQAYDSRRRSAEWDKHSLTIQQETDPAKTYRWEEISGLRHIFWMQAEQIEFLDGNKFVFFQTMTGSRELLDEIHAQLETRN